MKKLTCEICGGTDLVKKDGVFVCGACGTQYTVAEARKMMEDTVETKGFEEVAPSSELANLYQLARRARDERNSERAEQYYSQIVLKDPNSWEASFYSVYFQSMNCKIANIANAANRINNCEENILRLIKQYVTDPKERRNAVLEVAESLMYISKILFSSAKQHYDEISPQIKDRYKVELLSRVYASFDIVYSFGNRVVAMFGDAYAREVAVPCWKLAIELHTEAYIYLNDKEGAKAFMDEYQEKIRKYEPTYSHRVLEVDKKLKNGAKRVIATVIYLVAVAAAVLVMVLL